MYPLEAESRLDQCGMLPKNKKNSKEISGADLRYEQVFSLHGAKPNEYEIQTLSGVLETLSKMPDFDKYEPTYEAVKEATFYDMWKRRTIEYNVNCKLPISSALESL